MTTPALTPAERTEILERLRALGGEVEDLRAQLTAIQEAGRELLAAGTAELHRMLADGETPRRGYLRPVPNAGGAPAHAAPMGARAREDTR